ncbi:putative ribonuclease H-like domain-containing protein, partial [Tanacetum coccineum]
MANLKFVDTHNMVAFLYKPEESDGFEQIMDFLNAQPIKYALTFNPTISTLCIEQFWSTVKVKTVNGEVQLHALVDGKKIIITESIVIRDLRLEDAEGIDCLPNSTIFEQLALMGSKTTAWNEFSSTMASAIICLATNQKFNFSKYIFESMVKNLDNVSRNFLMYLRLGIMPKASSGKNKPSQSSGSYSSYATSFSKATKTATPGLADEVIHSFLATNADDIKKFYTEDSADGQVAGWDNCIVAVDKRKVECFNCHNTGHFSRECKFKGSKEGSRLEASRDHPKKVYKVVKALYGLHQAPRAWYATLSTFLEKRGYRRGTIDKTLFIKKDKKDIILVQIYVDDIIFGSTKKYWSDEFEALMKWRFQMSAIGELTFFLGLQVKQSQEGIFISQDKYVAEILKKFDFVSVKSAVTPMETKAPLAQDEGGPDVDLHLYRSMIGCLMYLTASRPDIMYAVCACSRFQVTPKVSHLYAVKRIFKYIKGKPKLGLWYPRESPLDLVAYSDSDYAAANLDRKSTTGGCQFLGRRLISWQCKKQTIVATSTTEAEYVAAASCCGQVLWLQNQLLDYGFNFMNTIIHIDNQSTICIIKNPVYHSKTKHIEIRHHFIRDCYEKKLIQVQKIHTDLNVADLLTKAFDGPRYYLELERMLQAQLGHEKGHASCHLLIGCRLVRIVLCVGGAFACVILSLLLEVALCKCSSTGRPLGAYNLGVTTPKALVYVGLMTCGDARSCGCSKHMTGDSSLLENFVEKFMGTVRFGNDHSAAITGLGHNLFSRGQVCDGDLEVAFRSKTCYVRNLVGDDLLTGARESNLYTISILDMVASSPIYLMSKATSTNSWSWHRRLSHLNFGTINDLTKHDLVDGHKIQTDNGTEFKNATLKARYKKLGIMQQFSIALTPEQNGIVERRNRTLVEAALTMLIFSPLPEFLWAEAISTACFTQNRSIIHPRYNKTPYELLHGRKPNVEYFLVFGSLCYPTNDRDDLGKMKPKADIIIFIRYSKTSRGFRIYNRRTKKIMETIHVKFDELTAMASEHG